MNLRGVLGAGAFSFALRGAGVALGLAAHVLIARTSGIETYGAFAYVYGWMLLLGLASKLGLDRALVRFGSPLSASGQFEGLATLHRFAVRFAALLGVGAGAAMAAASAVLADGMLRWALWIGALGVPLVAIHQVHLGTAQALRHTWRATAPEHLLRPAAFATLVLAFVHGLPAAPSAAQLVGCSVAALALVVCAEWEWTRRTLPRARASDPQARAEWLRFAWQMALVANLIGWTVQLDLLLVGSLLGETAAGAYSAASRIASFVPWVGLSAMTLFAPLAAELSSRHAHNELQRLVTPMARVISMLSLALAVGLAGAGPWLLPRVFGPGFEAAALPLALLAIGFAAQDLFGPGASIMNMSGRQAAAVRVSAIGALGALILHLWAIPRFELAGAAAVTGFVMVANSAALAWLLRHASGVDPSVLGLRAGNPSDRPRKFW